MPDLSDQAVAEIARCVRCGACQGVCPVYDVVRREHAAARGKIHLFERALAGGDEALQGRRLRDAISLCLKCGRCTVACPNSVRTADVVRHAREIRRSETPKNLKTVAASEILADRALMRGSAKFLRLVRSLATQKIEGRPGIVMRLAVPGEGARRTLPEPPDAGFFESAGGADVVVPGGGKKYLLFTGCVGDVLRPQASEAVVALARLAGVNVVAPARQVCCGLMSHMTGDRGTAEELARRNIEVFSMYGADAIVTPCASCATMIESHYPGIMPDAVLPEVITFSEFWSRDLEGRIGSRGAERSPVVLGFHEPCHMDEGTKERSTVRRMLSSLQRAVYVRTAGEDACCGYGGAFNVEHYGVSRAIGTKKQAGYRKAHVKLVATECAGCVLQLVDVLADQDEPPEVITTAEAVERYG
ncbi:MAG: (Fe-S)-binding protein [Deltaproteobacteria bacterium]|nr:(Fe-S)-binding protein [Deltaproteobacteria bacterium]